MKDLAEENRLLREGLRKSVDTYRKRTGRSLFVLSILLTMRVFLFFKEAPPPVVQLLDGLVAGFTLLSTHSWFLLWVDKSLLEESHKVEEYIRPKGTGALGAPVAVPAINEAYVTK